MATLYQAPPRCLAFHWALMITQKEVVLLPHLTDEKTEAQTSDVIYMAAVSERVKIGV